jgi:hypothetical protein
LSATLPRVAHYVERNRLNVAPTMPRSCRGRLQGDKNVRALQDSYRWWNSATGSARLVRRASPRTIRHLTASRRRSCRRSWLRSVPGGSTTLSLSSTASLALSFASSFFSFFSPLSSPLLSLLFATLVVALLLLSVLREGDQRDAQHPQPCHECSSTEGALRVLPLPRP